MLKTLKHKIIILMTALTLSVPVFIPVTASAACGNVANGVGSGINATSSDTQFSCGTGGSVTSGVKNLAKKVVDIFSVVVGIISVIMIIYAGFRYITSGGESGSVSSAKNTLIYAIIGLVIVVLAQIIVHYVLNTAATAGSQTGF